MGLRILTHRREGDTYRIAVHVDTSKVVAVQCPHCGDYFAEDQGGECPHCRRDVEHWETLDPAPDAAWVREFEWGPIPIAPEGVNPDAYVGVHNRPLTPGRPFVTEKEYVYLQICEALETVAEELREPHAGRKLLGEGLEV